MVIQRVAKVHLMPSFRFAKLMWPNSEYRLARRKSNTVVRGRRSGLTNAREAKALVLKNRNENWQRKKRLAASNRLPKGIVFLSEIDCARANTPLLYHPTKIPSDEPN